ncbi:MAG: DNA-directed RNA polymerase subunit L [Thermoplasmata archaeon]|nr:DNA-directed RNA polymerase subunit L [Thermoplasmata archaeon]
MMPLTMQTYLIEKTKTSIKIGFKDPNMTLITPMIKALNEDSNVKLVRYIDQHPELIDRALYVEVTKGDPAKAIEKAAESVSKYYSS